MTRVTIIVVCLLVHLAGGSEAASLDYQVIDAILDAPVEQPLRTRSIRTPAPIFVSALTPAATMSLTIDEFVELAVLQGLRSQMSRLEYENAGYAKDIIFKQTVGPALSANMAGNLTQTRTNGVLTRVEDGQSDMTLTQPLPSGTVMSLTGKYTTTLTRSPTASQRDILRPGWSASLTQPIYLFVKNPLLRSRRRGRLTFESADDAYRSSILSIKAQARSLYYDVLLKKGSLHVEQRKLRASRTLLDITKDMVRAGKLAPVETTRSLVRMERDRRQVQSAAANWEKAKEAANNFANFSLNQGVEYRSVLEYEPFDLPLDQLRDFAIAHRPELKRLRRSRELARLDVDEAKEPLRPTVNLAANYGSNETDSMVSGTDSKSLSREWKAGANLTWRFFDSFITRDQVLQARNAAALADLAYEEAVRNTALEVESAYRDVKTAEAQFLNFRSARDSAKENVEILRIQFMNGRGKIIDVFDAENEERSVELEYLNLLTNYYTTQDKLAQLLGTGLADL